MSLCALLTLLLNGGWLRKGDRGHPAHKTKIVMSKRRRGLRDEAE